MKSTNIIILLFVFSVGLFTNAEAQRRGNNGGQRDNSQSGVSQSRVERAPQRTFNTPARTERNNSNNNSFNNQRVTSINNNTAARASRQNTSSNNIARVNSGRNQPVAIESQRNSSTSRVFPRSSSGVDQQRRYDRDPVRGNNNNRNSNYRNNNNRNNTNNRNNNYRNNNYRSSSYRNVSYNRNYYYRSGYNRPIYIMSGPRYSYRPYNCVSVYFGSYPYYYSSGLFYDYYGGYYQPIFPPFGIRISTLPFGYSRIYVGLNPYYYYGGIFYRQYENNYEVVDAPMGATVSSLPDGAKSVMVNGEKFYELNGTYFKEDRDSKGRQVYIVVGKNGEINNSYEDDASNLDAPQSLQLQNGDIVPQLPEGSKVITLNGEKLYVAPDNTYLKEETNGDTVQYRVVGNDEK